MSLGKYISEILIKIILLFCLINFGSCKLNDTNNSIQMLSVVPRIVGGYHPGKNYLEKYVVSIRPLSETGAKFGNKHICAGIIIGPNSILTAGHCVYKKLLQSTPYFKIVAKTPKRLNKNSHTQEINVKTVILHSEYNDDYLYNDIALLVLEEDLLLDSEMATIISLPKEDIEPGEICQVIGWGRLYTHGPMANDLLYADVNLQTNEYCASKYDRFTSDEICAMNFNDYEVGVCVGDSGGPLICNGTVTGIVSYGLGCGYGNDVIYTNVYKYVKWIEGNGQISLQPAIPTMMTHLLLIAAWELFYLEIYS